MWTHGRYPDRSYVYYFSTMNMIKLKNSKNLKLKVWGGFTLLELLVVIGIIGVLTALATVAYSTTQVGGRNARRKQDVIAIQNALEQYYSANSFAYPAADCTEAVTYLKGSWPTDPLSTVLVPKSYLIACQPASYCVCGEMEGSAATRGNSGLGCDWSAAEKAYYCVGNLQ